MAAAAVAAAVAAVAAAVAAARQRDVGGSLAVRAAAAAMVIDGLCCFIEGGDVCSRSVYVRIGTPFFVVEEGAIFNCT